MPRLILVPQYPTKLRYQERWLDIFVENFKARFSELVVLGSKWLDSNKPAGKSDFAPVELAVAYEAQQITEFIEMTLYKDDVLLLNDISFPGLFANVLLHKSPEHCFAICHGTSLNRYDYFSSKRSIKWPIEKAQAKLFNVIFVATNYHRDKLKLPNVCVSPFPILYDRGYKNEKEYLLISASRKTRQKRSTKIETIVTQIFGGIQEINAISWREYYQQLSKASILLITAKEETYGYQIMDGVLNGCVPLAPNKYSYPEILPSDYLYEDVHELVNKIQAVRVGDLKPLKFADLKVYDKAVLFFSAITNVMYCSIIK